MDCAGHLRLISCDFGSTSASLRMADMSLPLLVRLLASRLHAEVERMRHGLMTASNDSQGHDAHAKVRRWAGWLAHFKDVIWVLSSTAVITLQPSTQSSLPARLRSSKRTGEKARRVSLADNTVHAKSKCCQAHLRLVSCECGSTSASLRMPLMSGTKSPASS